MPILFDFNKKHHKYKNIHDETGGTLNKMFFQYNHCFCGCSESEVISTTTRHHNQFTVVRCENCSTLRINPYLSEDSVAFYYKEIYGRIKRSGMLAADLYEAQKMGKDSKALFSRLNSHAGKENNILDYGSGAGGRLDEFLLQGYQQLYLFDYDEKYVDYGISKGFKKHEPDKKYQLIILSHVIEHINEPTEILRKLSGMLEVGGHIYIEVPMYENTKNLLRDFHLAHKYYFTKLSLTLLANLAGLKVVSDYKNAILVTPGRVDVSDFSVKNAKEVWFKQKSLVGKKNFYRRISYYLKYLFRK